MAEAAARRLGWGSRLNQSDLGALLKFLRRIYESQDLRSFRTQIVFGLQQMVGSEINAYNEVDLRAQHNTVVYDRPEVIQMREGAEIFDRYVLQHPVIAYSRGRRGHGAVMLSDFTSVGGFHRLELYNEFFRPIGIEDQMVLSLPSVQPVVIGIVLNRRRRNFTERDRALLNAAYPHLLQAYKNAKAWTRLQGELALSERAMNESQTAVVVLTRTGRVRIMTTAAKALLERYLSKQCPRRYVLPDLIQRWIKLHSDSFEPGIRAPLIREPLVVKGNGRNLVVRLFPDENGHVLLFEESRARGPEDLGLTQRETEVLEWVSYGKTNAEISVILGTSPRTVQKHLEHIFEKLGVETRTGAVRQLFDVNWPAFR